MASQRWSDLTTADYRARDVEKPHSFNHRGDDVGGDDAAARLAVDRGKSRGLARSLAGSIVPPVIGACRTHGRRLLA